ncbi:MAG: terpene cyclase/mutase family protein [Planctomyces sp.]|nr:terpene cyclase/mutase family protein [Planctomyces sp.]
MGSAKSPQPDRDGKNAPSVLTQVEQRTRLRRRRRGKPPAWVLWLAQNLPRAGRFMKETAPSFIVQNRDRLTAAFVALLIHVLVLMILGVIPMPDLPSESIMNLIVRQIDPAELDPIETVEMPINPEQLSTLDANSALRQAVADLDLGITSDQFDSPDERDLSIPLDETALDSEITARLGELGGRSSAGKQAALKKFGGNADSEKAVNSGLKWLSSIQQKDGSWSFAKVGDSPTPGTFGTTDMGATAMSLLCFLGAGHTHQTDGPYKETVRQGLAWMFANAVRGSSGADLRGKFQGNAGMYVQGIAAICICEASAMEPDDRELRKLAGEAITFIERAQDPVGGGWRYTPREKGDTSVTGWQLMALQSARAGRIRYSTQTTRDAREFLDSVSAEQGSRYGYTDPDGNNPTMTAVALLCRMYMGWKREHPGLAKGVQYLSDVGPSEHNIYYNYYATQVLHHWGGEQWEKWNNRLRPHLVSTQVQDGPAAGSWDVTDPHGNAGGRIYQTTLSVLTLEVYYRHLPIYRKFDADEKQDDADRAVGR